MTDDHGKLRISNADRDEAIRQLQAALDEGRIDLGEFDERAKTAYEAKTNAELDLIFDDLPGGRPKAGEVALGDRTDESAREGTADRDGCDVGWGAVGHRDGRNWIQETPALRGLVVVGTICTLIWLAGSISSRDFDYFWPIWPILGLSIATCMQLFNRGRWH